MLFFFDYDGVLVPIKGDPSISYLPKKTRKTLLYLANLPNIKISLVSGRNLNMLKKLSRITTKNIILVGTYGLEMHYQGKRTYLFKQNKKELKEIKKELIKSAKSISKGFIENKPYSFAYHVRGFRKVGFIQKLTNSFTLIIKEKNLESKLMVLHGKNMIEVLPSSVSKGKAIEKIIKSFPGYSYIYFGDDISDVSAFKIMKKYRGISVSLNQRLGYKTDFLIKSDELTNNLLKAIVLTSVY